MHGMRRQPCPCAEPGGRLETEGILFAEQQVTAGTARNHDLVAVLKRGCACRAPIILKLAVEKPSLPVAVQRQSGDSVKRTGAERQIMLVHRAGRMAERIVR